MFLPVTTVQEKILRQSALLVTEQLAGLQGEGQFSDRRGPKVNLGGLYDGVFSYIRQEAVFKRPNLSRLCEFGQTWQALTAAVASGEREGVQLTDRSSLALTAIEEYRLALNLFPSHLGPCDLPHLVRFALCSRRVDAITTMPVTAVGIAGATCSGKTTLAQSLVGSPLLPSCSSCIFHQDDYYKDEESCGSDWDAPEAILHDKLLADVVGAIKEAQRSSKAHLIIVEGFLLLHDARLTRVFDLLFFLDIPKDVCWQRRWERDEWIRTNAAYFEEQVWPNYMRHTCTRVANIPSAISLDGQQAFDVLLAFVAERVSGALCGSA